jgi:hypothetical protein
MAAIPFHHFVVLDFRTESWILTKIKSAASFLQGCSDAMTRRIIGLAARISVRLTAGQAAQCMRQAETRNHRPRRRRRIDLSKLSARAYS